MKEEKKNNIVSDLKKMNIVPLFGFTVFANFVVAGLIGYFIDKFTFNNRIIFIIF